MQDAADVDVCVCVCVCVRACVRACVCVAYIVKRLYSLLDILPAVLLYLKK